MGKGGDFASDSERLPGHSGFGAAVFVVCAYGLVCHPLALR
jgi:hypothetical protein